MVGVELERTVTGDVTPDYLDRLEFARHHPKAVEEDATRGRLNLNLATTE